MKRSQHRHAARRQLRRARQSAWLRSPEFYRRKLYLHQMLDDQSLQLERMIRPDIYQEQQP